MPYTTDSASEDYRPSEPLPDHLAHKPAYALPYEKFDGHFADDPSKQTDIRYISVGNAQYDPDQVSIKTMRYVGKWTRQAEELPLHRLIDMATFLAMALFQAKDGQIEVPAGTFHNQKHAIHVTREARSYGEIASYNEYLKQYLPLHQERFNALYELLSELKSEGKF